MKHYEQMLAGIEKNETGHIVSARALQVIWMIMVNFTAVDMDKTGNDGGTSDWVKLELLLLVFFYKNNYFRQQKTHLIGS